MSLDRPNWNDIQDRNLYNELFYKSDKKLTDKEDDFVKTMYHFEEFACGLDGD